MQGRAGPPACHVGRLVRRPGGPPRHKVTKRGRREWNGRGGQGPLAEEGRLYLAVQGLRVPSYATADGASGLPT